MQVAGSIGGPRVAETSAVACVNRDDQACNGHSARREPLLVVQAPIQRAVPKLESTGPQFHLGHHILR
jgi:hypothetical protein